MLVVASNKTACELVLEKYPTAFVDDDGEWIYIRIGETERINCGECSRPYTRNKPTRLCRAVGGAGNNDAAWKDAAKNLSLM